MISSYRNAPHKADGAILALLRPRDDHGYAPEVTLRRREEERLPARLDIKEVKVHSRTRILVEDNAVDQKVAVKILERLGYRADATADGLEACRCSRVPLKSWFVGVQDFSLGVLPGGCEGFEGGAGHLLHCGAGGAFRRFPREDLYKVTPVVVVAVL